MIRIAKNEDLDSCLELLSQLRSISNVTAEYLYLDNNKDGFTILVEKEDKPIAISTFSIRQSQRRKDLIKVLYWENLVVDQHHRNGLAYIKIIGYIRELIKIKKFDDVYFVARRKKVLKLHKSSKIKVFGYLDLVLHSVLLKRKPNTKNITSYNSYSEFIKSIDFKNEFDDFGLNKFNGLENISENQLKRQLSNKIGRVLVDHKKRNILFLRSLYKNFLVEINLLVPGSFNQSIHNLKGFGSALITINLCLLKAPLNKKRSKKLLRFLTYEALNLSGEGSLESFQIWEHDAW